MYEVIEQITKSKNSFLEAFYFLIQNVYFYIRAIALVFGLLNPHEFFWYRKHFSDQRLSLIF